MELNKTFAAEQLTEGYQIDLISDLEHGINYHIENDKDIDSTNDTDYCGVSITARQAQYILDLLKGEE